MIIILLTILISQVEQGGQSPKPVRIRILGGVSFAHADNIFRLSPAHRDAFINKGSVGQFTKIKSYDDFITTYELTLRLRREIFGFRRTRFSFRYVGYDYAVNSIKDYHTFTLRLRQDISKSAYFSIDYFLLPSFYIRHYREEESRVFKRFCYRHHLVTFRLGKSFRTKTTLIGSYKYEFEDFNSSFDEFDTRAHFIGAEVRQEVLPNLRLDLEYRYKNASAKGSPTSDFSHIEHSIEGGIRIDIGRALRIRGSYRYRDREFTTQIEKARLHFGRRDRRSRVRTELLWRLTRRVSLNLSYEYRRRESSLPIKKNYIANRFTAGVDFRI